MTNRIVVNNMKKKTFLNRPESSILRAGKLAAAVCAAVCATTAQAYPLKAILRDAMVSDPIVKEAKATEDSAKSTTKATRARHYPVLTLTGTKVLAQKNKYSSSDMSDGVGIRGTVNVYSWGAINAAVRRDKNREQYYHHRYFENQERLGSDIGKLYLTALRAKEILRINRQSLVRHNNLLKDLNIIVPNLSKRVRASCRSNHPSRNNNARWNWR